MDYEKSSSSVHDQAEKVPRYSTSRGNHLVYKVKKTIRAMRGASNTSSEDSQSKHDRIATTYASYRPYADGRSKTSGGYKQNVAMGEQGDSGASTKHQMAPNTSSGDGLPVPDSRIRFDVHGAPGKAKKPYFRKFTGMNFIDDSRLKDESTLSSGSRSVCGQEMKLASTKTPASSKSTSATKDKRSAYDDMMQSYMSGLKKGENYTQRLQSAKTRSAAAGKTGEGLKFLPAKPVHEQIAFHMREYGKDTGMHTSSDAETVEKGFKKKNFWEKPGVQHSDCHKTMNQRSSVRRKILEDVKSLLSDIKTFQTKQMEDPSASIDPRSISHPDVQAMFERGRKLLQQRLIEQSLPRGHKPEQMSGIPSSGWDKLREANNQAMMPTSNTANSNTNGTLDKSRTKKVPGKSAERKTRPCFVHCQSKESTVYADKWGCSKTRKRPAASGNPMPETTNTSSGYHRLSEEDSETKANQESPATNSDNTAKQAPWTCTKWSENASPPADNGQCKWAYEVYSNTCLKTVDPEAAHIDSYKAYISPRKVLSTRSTDTGGDKEIIPGPDDSSSSSQGNGAFKFDHFASLSHGGRVELEDNSLLMTKTCEGGGGHGHRVSRDLFQGVPQELGYNSTRYDICPNRLAGGAKPEPCFKCASIRSGTDSRGSGSEQMNGNAAITVSIDNCNIPHLQALRDAEETLVKTAESIKQNVKTVFERLYPGEHSNDRHYYSRAFGDCAIFSQAGEQKGLSCESLLPFTRMFYPYACEEEERESEESYEEYKQARREYEEIIEEEDPGYEIEVYDIVKSGVKKPSGKAEKKPIKLNKRPPGKPVVSPRKVHEGYTGNQRQGDMQCVTEMSLSGRRRTPTPEPQKAVFVPINSTTSTTSVRTEPKVVKKRKKKKRRTGSKTNLAERNAKQASDYTEVIGEVRRKKSKRRRSVSAQGEGENIRGSHGDHGHRPSEQMGKGAEIHSLGKDKDYWNEQADGDSRRRGEVKLSVSESSTLDQPTKPRRKHKKKRRKSATRTGAYIDRAGSDAGTVSVTGTPVPEKAKRSKSRGKKRRRKRSTSSLDRANDSSLMSLSDSSVKSDREWVEKGEGQKKSEKTSDGKAVKSSQVNILPTAPTPAHADLKADVNPDVPKKTKSKKTPLKDETAETEPIASPQASTYQSENIQTVKISPKKSSLKDLANDLPQVNEQDDTRRSLLKPGLASDSGDTSSSSRSRVPESSHASHGTCHNRSYSSSHGDLFRSISTSELNKSIMMLYDEINKLRAQLEASADESSMLRVTPTFEDNEDKDEAVYSSVPSSCIESGTMPGFQPSDQSDESAAPLDEPIEYISPTSVPECRSPVPVYFTAEEPKPTKEASYSEFPATDVTNIEYFPSPMKQEAAELCADTSPYTKGSMLQKECQPCGGRYEKYARTSPQSPVLYYSKSSTVKNEESDGDPCYFSTTPPAYSCHTAQGEFGEGLEKEESMFWSNDQVSDGEKPTDTTPEEQPGEASGGIEAVVEPMPGDSQKPEVEEVEGLAGTLETPEVESVSTSDDPEEMKEKKKKKKKKKKPEIGAPYSDSIHSGQHRLFSDTDLIYTSASPSQTPNIQEDGLRGRPEMPTLEPLAKYHKKRTGELNDDTRSDFMGPGSYNNNMRPTYPNSDKPTLHHSPVGAKAGSLRRSMLAMPSPKPKTPPNIDSVDVDQQSNFSSEPSGSESGKLDLRERADAEFGVGGNSVGSRGELYGPPQRVPSVYGRGAPPWYNPGGYMIPENYNQAIPKPLNEYKYDCPMKHPIPDYVVTSRENQPAQNHFGHKTSPKDTKSEASGSQEDSPTGRVPTPKLMSCVKDVFFRSTKAQVENADKDTRQHQCPPTRKHLTTGQHNSLSKKVSEEYYRGSNIEEFCLGGYIVDSRKYTGKDDRAPDRCYIKKSGQGSSVIHRDVDEKGVVGKFNIRAPNDINERSPSYDEEPWLINQVCTCSLQNQHVQLTGLNALDQTLSVSSCCSSEKVLHTAESACKLRSHYSDAIKSRSRKALASGESQFTLTRDLNPVAVSGKASRPTCKSIKETLPTKIPGSSHSIFKGFKQTHEGGSTRLGKASPADSKKKSRTSKSPDHKAQQQLLKPESVAAEHQSQGDHNIVASFESLMQKRRPCYVEHCGFKHKKRDNAMNERFDFPSRDQAQLDLMRRGFQNKSKNGCSSNDNNSSHESNSDVDDEMPGMNMKAFGYQLLDDEDDLFQAGQDVSLGFDGEETDQTVSPNYFNYARAAGDGPMKSHVIIEDDEEEEEDDENLEQNVTSENFDGNDNNGWSYDKSQSAGDSYGIAGGKDKMYTEDRDDESSDESDGSSTDTFSGDDADDEIQNAEDDHGQPDEEEDLTESSDESGDEDECEYQELD